MIKFVRFSMLTLFLLLASLLLLACQSGIAQPSTVPTEEAAPQEAAPQEAAPQEAAPQEAAPQEEAPQAEVVAEAPAPVDIEAEGLTTFEIVPAQSEARFTIDEVLRGSPKTVVGVSSQVSGRIFVDPADPSRTEIGPIQIDASSFVTDSDRRNGAIRRFILQSNNEAYQFITFTPIAIDGLPGAVNVGDTFEISVTGDLTIRDVTRPETFILAITANSDTEISGLGYTTILYDDYGISIPSVPFVASVADEVLLEIEFAAVDKS